MFVDMCCFWDPKIFLYRIIIIRVRKVIIRRRILLLYIFVRKKVEKGRVQQGGEGNMREREE